MMNSVPFMTVEDEPRIIELVKGLVFLSSVASFIILIMSPSCPQFTIKGWIAKGEVPEYKQFIEEPKSKRDRRHKKYAKEAREAAAIRREMEKKSKNVGSLEQQIMKRQTDRESASNSFLDRLLQKYGGPDDSEEYVFPTKKKTKKPSAKESINKVKSGRVTKKK